MLRKYPTFDCAMNYVNWVGISDSRKLVAYLHDSRKYEKHGVRGKRVEFGRVKYF